VVETLRPCRVAVSGRRLVPVQPIAFEMSVKERRSGGRTWGEQAGAGGGGWNAIDDVTPAERAFEGRPSIIQTVATPERSKRAEHLVVLLPPGRARVSRCSTALSRWSSLRPEAYLQLRRPAPPQRAPQLVFVEVFFSGVPQKTSRTELLLPPPRAQRRPHGAGLEPAGPICLGAGRLMPCRDAIFFIRYPGVAVSRWK
jgi:hypothetical protein